jgi:uncharacterized iron-regulated membrane protein
VLTLPFNVPGSSYSQLYGQATGLQGALAKDLAGLWGGLGVPQSHVVVNWTQSAASAATRRRLAGAGASVTLYVAALFPFSGADGSSPANISATAAAAAARTALGFLQGNVSRSSASAVLPSTAAEVNRIAASPTAASGMAIMFNDASMAAASSSETGAAAPPAPGGLSGGAIAAIVVVLLAVALAVGGFLLFRKRKTLSRRSIATRSSRQIGKFTAVAVNPLGPAAPGIALSPVSPGSGDEWQPRRKKSTRTVRV